MRVSDRQNIGAKAQSGLLLELISVMWNHAPEMEKMVTEMNLIWPRFEKNEMKDLISYIQSLK